MFLKRIEIHGFKSFADRITIDISEGITAIVGPNGSGKSNVSDAVRWVLGEQSARALRGNKMEDVIFDGAEKRRPLSFCEVSLTFDNEDGFLAMPHNEVSVSRRVYRSGESEYLINKSTCRMKDINALFYDTGVGREGYSIIGQGRIEEILSPRGEERRAAFEEAAGVMKYKVRREEAQRKLKNVGKDMQRIDDILGELEQSIEPLREQSEQAREFIAIKEELRLLDLNIFINRYTANEDKRLKLAEKERELEAAEATANKKDGDIRHQLSILADKLDLTQQLLDRAREKELEYSASVQRTNGELELLRQKRQHLENDTQRLQDENQSSQETIAELEKALSGIEISGEEVLEIRERELKQLEQAAAEAQQQAENTEAELDALKQQLMDIVDSAGERKARIARMEMLGEQARARMDEIKQAAEQGREQQKLLEAEVASVKAELDGIYQNRDHLARGTIEAEQAATELRNRLDEAERAAREAEQAAQNATQTLRIQQQLKRDYEGYANSVRHLMKDISSQQSGEVYGVVGELLNVPPEYEKAIELTLGGSLQNVVVQNEQTAKQLIAYLRKKDYGRVTFLPVQALRARTFNPGEKRQLGGNGVIGVASDLIGYSAEVQPAVDYLLGRTVIVEDMDSGIALSRRLSFNFRCVTLQGDIINAGGPITGGSNREKGLVSRDRLIDDAKKQLRQANNIFKEEIAKAKNIKATLEQKTIEAQTLRRDVYSVEARIAAAEERLDATIYQKLKADDEVARYDEEVQRAETAIQAAGQSALAGADTTEEEETTLRARVDKVGADLAERRIRRDETAEAYNKERVEFAAFQSEITSGQKNRERMERDLARMRRELEARDQNMRRNADEMAELASGIAGLESSFQQLTGSDDENKIALDKLEQEKANLDKQSVEYADAREQLQQQLGESVKKRYNIKAQVERLMAEYENMQNRIWEEYSLSYANALDFKQEIKMSEATVRADDLRTRMHEMDYVNPHAIEEFERVSTRYDFLNTQREDLGKAKEDLEKLIDELTKEMETKFLEQFYRINECFGRVFKSLFGGGHAELVLQDKNNAMESQIEIIAQPPGKKLQLLSLLSGGERALTAIAILFAMLELKATPFCILDEIEAALDEENLRLFADYLKEYSKKTQFIVITHRRPTMEAAATMYGIAMEEKGVSKLVSVKFAEAVAG